MTHDDVHADPADDDHDDHGDVDMKADNFLGESP